MPIFHKVITGSVGRAASNSGADVRVVKYLLNNVPEENGGPVGVIQEITSINDLIFFIEGFQRSNFGRADGRVDPEGRTLQKLREFDPTPGEPPFVPTLASGKKKRSGKKGDNPSEPSPPLPKSIVSPVGRGGVNSNGDVNVIKHLLNHVPDNRGGPIDVLLTRSPIEELIAGIQRFQLHQLGFSDGRVDPNGLTLRNLKAFDPFPLGPVFVPDFRSKPKGGKR